MDSSAPTEGVRWALVSARTPRQRRRRASRSRDNDRGHRRRRRRRRGPAPARSACSPSAATCRSATTRTPRPRPRRRSRTIDGVRYAVPGDCATVEADGTISLLGRGSVVINTGGEKVFPEEVEQVLVDHPGVAEAVVVGVPDDRWGSRVTALVVPVPGAELDLDALADHVGSRLAGYKRPRLVRLVAGHPPDGVREGRPALGAGTRPWSSPGPLRTDRARSGGCRAGPGPARSGRPSRAAARARPAAGRRGSGGGTACPR